MSDLDLQYELHRGCDEGCCPPRVVLMVVGFTDMAEAVAFFHAAKPLLFHATSDAVKALDADAPASALAGMQPAGRA